MKKILIPTDFSEQANNALKVAIQIAKKCGAEIHLLHIEEYVGNVGFSALGDVEADSSAMDKLFMLKLLEVNKKRMLELIDTIDDEVTVFHMVEIGQMFRLVREYVTGQGIDLVVMGTNGASGFSGALIGSNTEKVVRQVGCPVLSVRNLPEVFDMKKIVFATNFDGDQTVVTEQLKQFQTIFGAHLYLLYVNTIFSFSSSRTIRERVTQFVTKHGLTNYEFHSYNDETEERGIIHFADEVDADVIAVATHGRTGFSHLLLGSIAEDIVNHALRPVLTFHLG
ncbi:universal stress protein [Xanthocytophaga agilis]|uniref:Universal stress protein n=1 Tax=Xanthocytophaga agilis TaxID=3048010 RepID=A0AAE3QWI2_9BACT|nr:universal stress protein [Xanthocytophaga agilis]MDJ1499266.1 universal stress protein [Xanthocytophaga agilis]